MSDGQNAGFNFNVSTGADASIFAVNQLPDVFGIVKEKLQLAANNPNIFTDVFGDKVSTPELRSVIEEWRGGIFNQLPIVQVVASSVLNHAAGAYDTSTQTVYLSDAIFGTGAPPQDVILAIAKTLTEEIGHFLDAKVGKDTVGDEGERFKDSVFGVQISADELNRINNEDDHGSIFVNGQAIAVEFAGSSSDFGINLNSASYSKTDNKFVKVNGTGGTYLWCTDFAYGRALEKGLIQQDKGIGSKISGWAGQWDDQAGSWSKQVQANSFVVWDPWTGGTLDGGHVAFVERVNSDGSFVVSECNWDSARMSFNSRTISQKDNPNAFNSAKFIYLGNNPTPDPNNGFNGNETNILWRNSITGATTIWTMKDGIKQSTTFLENVSETGGWKVAGTGDFNGDGTTDILWRNSLSGMTTIWTMKGGTKQSTTFLENVSEIDGWKVAGLLNITTPLPLTVPVKSPSSTTELNVSVSAVTSIIGGYEQNVSTYLPAVIDALKEFGIYTKNTVIATIATIGTEVGSFAPINEYGDNAYFTRMYEGRKDLGNTQAGDGAKYHGRGFIQLTGRANYQYYGNALGVDLVNNPNLALDPNIAARILALYFKNRGIAALAENSNWEGVRRGVNGGLNGLDRFIGLVNKAKQYIV